MGYDPRLEDYCVSDQEREKVRALVETGGNVEAAIRLLNTEPRNFKRSKKRIEERAAAQGYAPNFGINSPVPKPYIVKGISTLYDEVGEVKQQWVKTSLDREQSLEAIRDAIEDWAGEIKGLAPAVKSPSVSLSDLLSVYCMGDPHFGMYAWAKETGENFNLDIAEKLTKGAIDRLVQSGPASETALLINLGDFFHADNSSNQTPSSGHALDVDTRHSKVMQVGFRAIRYAALRLLEKHKQVIFWSVRGNHDPESSFALALCMDAFFHNEPRLTADLTPGLFHYHRFGKVLIGAHHGHAAKPNELPGIMAFDRKEDWGATDFRYWYLGHVHHTSKKHADEYPGVEIETFRTMAPSDAWHKGKGYRSGRDMRLIVHHRERGMVEMHRCDASEFKDA